MFSVMENAENFKKEAKPVLEDLNCPPGGSGCSEDKSKCLVVSG